MQAKSVSAGQYRNKLTLLFLVISVFIVLTPFLTGWMLYGIVGDIRQIYYFYTPDKAMAGGLNTNVRRYEVNAGEARKSLTDLQRVIYEPRSLQGTLAEEFLGSGLAADNFTVRTVSAANKAKTIPGKGGEDWKYFNFASATLNGSIEADKIPQLMFFLAARQKLWHISALEIQPMDTPADLVNRYQKIEMDIAAQGRTFERDSLLELINKRSNKNKISVSIAFFVPIIVEGEGL
jgi:hypothetical protein